jgi:hypothetical protein
MPTRDTAWPTGTPCWVDYGAADMEAARAFYTDVFGWTYADVDGRFAVMTDPWGAAFSVMQNPAG